MQLCNTISPRGSAGVNGVREFRNLTLPTKSHPRAPYQGAVSLELDNATTVLFLEIGRWASLWNKYSIQSKPHNPRPRLPHTVDWVFPMLDHRLIVVDLDNTAIRDLRRFRPCKHTGFLLIRAGSGVVADQPIFRVPGTLNLDITIFNPCSPDHAN